MTKHLNRFVKLLACIGIAAIFATQSQADPLPGRDVLKFDQQPMNATPIVNSQGISQIYGGHDELSTAYGFPNAAAGGITQYDGKFMADDFADKLSTPVVHVRWWGSYHNNIVNTQFPVNKFLIAFESDVPAPTPGFSSPGQVQQLDVVDRALSLSTGSGQFTEKLIRGPDPIFNESLYEYNAELHLNKSFPESANTVYWLKIAALIDVPAGISFSPSAPPPNVTQWGWHNRDYTIKDTLASTSPSVVPGEFLDGTISGSNIWHFQDDAVQGDLRWLTQPGVPNFGVTQNNMAPQFYVDFADGPGGNTAGTPGISTHSKDLAFQLFTTGVPEPGACVLMSLGLAGALATRRRSTSA
jgi:hypothetical protein